MSSSLSLLDVHEIHEVSVLHTASSSPDSGSSIGTGSPTLLIPEHDVRSSFCSSNGTPTVKFAPLPQIDANRKRSLAPLGVSARSRRKQIVLQEECGSLAWSPDPNVPETMEDPIITFAKFVKKTGQTLWRRLRKRSRVGPEGNEVSDSAEFILDIRPIVQLSDSVAPGEKGHCMPDRTGSAEVKRGRRASWSPSGERGTLNQDLRAKRSSTSDLPPS